MSERKIRILHVLGSMNPGGVERWLLNILEFIDRSQFQLDICTFGPEAGLYASLVEELGGRMVACPIGSNVWSFRNHFLEILRRGRYDIVHSHVTFFSGAVLRWAHAVGVPIRIAHSHTSHDEKPQTIRRRFYRRVMGAWINRYATHGLAASELAAAELFGENWRKDRRLGILHCGIDLRPFENHFDRGSIREELGIPHEARVVGHVGRFDVQKNHRFLVEVARAIVDKHQDIHFLCVGNGPLRHQVEGQCKDLGLSSNMHFAGIRTDVPRLMSGAMDVFILPSLWEGLPLALIEAQAAGLFCVHSSEIAEEASILAERCVRLSISEAADKWAQETIDALGRGRFHIKASLGRIAATDFCIERSSSYLSSLYVKAAG